MAEKKKKKISSAAASAVATVTAAGVLVGGAYSSPEELLNDGQEVIVQTLVNNDVQVDDGAGPDDFEEEMAGAEEEEKRGVHAAVRKRMRAAPAGVRALVGIPLWGLGTVFTALLSSLWSSVLSPAASALLSWVGIALMALLIFTLAVKTAFPDLPLKKILNKRSILTIGILCLLFGIADAALPFFWEDYLKLSKALRIVGSLLCTGVPAVFFVRRRCHREPEKIVAEVVEPEPAPEPTLEEKEAAARRLVEELADSVSRKTY